MSSRSSFIFPTTLLLISILVTLIDAACTTTTPSGTTFSPPQSLSGGTILSDPDGYDVANTTGAGQDCNWQVECPAGYSVGFTNIQGETMSSSQQVQFIRGTATTGGTILYNVFGSFHDNYMFSMENIITIVYRSSSGGSGTSISPGFTLTWQCFPTTCSSPNVSGSVFTNPEGGMIWSDPDGSGSQFNYLYKESCAWYIECPLNQNVVVNGIRGQTFGTTDQIKFTNAAPGASTNLLGSSYGLSLKGAILPTHIAKVTFGSTSSADITSNGKTGFSLYWTCSSQLCSSMNGSSAVVASSSPSSSSPQAIISDRDGLGTTFPYLANENCKWDISCPDNLAVVITELAGTLTSSTDIVSVYDNNNTQTTLVSQVGWQSSDFVYGFYTKLNSVHLRFVSGPSVLPASYGWTLNFLCSNSTCRSPNVTGSTYNVLPASSGSGASSAPNWLWSDEDGALLSYYYLTGQKCQWTIACPQNYKFGIVQLEGLTYSSLDSIVVSPGSGSSTFSTRRIYGSQIYDDVEIFNLGPNPNPTVDISFQPTSGRVSTGWALQYQCFPYMCASPTASQTMTAIAGEVLTDQDGMGSHYYLPKNMNCEWFIRCPNPYNFFLAWVEGNSYGNDAINFRGSNGDIITIGGYRLGSSRQAALLRSGLVDMSFLTTGTDPGFTVTYRCQTAMCSSLNVTGSTYSANEGSIMSDLDGGGYINYLNNESCSWTIKCPNPTDIIAFSSMRIVLISGDSLRITNAGVIAPGSSGSSAIKTFTGGYSIVSTLTLTDANVISISFSSSAIGSVTDGFTIDWVCRSSQCSSLNSTHIVFSGSGVIASDVDGEASETYYQKNERCSWTIQCDSGEYVYYYLRGRLRATDVVSLTYGPGLSIVENDGISFSREGYLSPYGGPVTLAFSSTPTSSTYYGFSFYYSCQPTKCSSPTKSGSTLKDPFGVILSDIDGSSSSTYYAASEDCTWTIQCPSIPVNNKTSNSTTSSSSSITSIFFSFDGYLYSSVDSLAVETVPTSGSNKFTTLANIYGLTTNSWVFNQSAIRINWKTSASTQRYGFTITYHCRGSLNQGSCFSSPTNASVYRSSSGTLLSDPDGSGASSRYAAGMMCSWSVECPDPRQVLRFSIVGALSSKDYLSVSDTGNGGGGSSGSGNGFQSFLASSISTSTMEYIFSRSSTIRVDFMSLSSSSAGIGFNFSWTCVATNCDATVPSGKTMNASTGGVIQSDRGGSSTTLYTSGQQCVWDLDCGPTKSFSVRLIGSTAGYEDVLSIYTVTDGSGNASSSFTKYLSYSSSNINVDSTWYPSKLRLVWSTSWSYLYSYSSNSRKGWTFTYTCVSKIAPPPPTPVPGAPSSSYPCSIIATSSGTTSYTSSSGTVGFRKGTSYKDNERCQWTISCRSNKMVMKVTSHVNTASQNDYLGVVAASGERHHYSGCCHDAQLLLPTSQVEFSFTSDANGRSSNGAYAEYVCLAPDSTAGSTAFVGATAITVGALLGKPGSVSSAGSGTWSTSSRYENNMNTLTLLYCVNSGSSIVITQIQGQTYNMNDVLALYEVRSDRLTLLKRWYGSSFGTSPNYASTVSFLVHFKTDAVLVDQGYQINYECRGGSSSGGASASASIKSDYRLSTGAAVGIAVGGCVFILFGVILLVVMMKKRARARQQRQAGEQYRGAADADAGGDPQEMSPRGGEGGGQAPSSPPPPGQDQHSGGPQFSTLAPPPPGGYHSPQQAPQQYPSGEVVQGIIYNPGPPQQYQTQQRTAQDTQQHQPQGGGSSQLGYSPGSPRPVVTRSSSTGATASSTLASPPPPSPLGGEGGQQPQRTRQLSDVMSVNNDPSQPYCILCMAHKPIYALVPCGHTILCEECHKRFEPQSCPMCRVHATTSMKVTFLPTPSVAADVAAKDGGMKSAITTIADVEEVDIEFEGEEQHGGGSDNKKEATTTAGAATTTSTTNSTSSSSSSEASCVVCHSQPALCALVPCGHVCLCEKCKPERCPACEGFGIGAPVRIYK